MSVGNNVMMHDCSTLRFMRIAGVGECRDRVHFAFIFSDGCTRSDSD